MHIQGIPFHVFDLENTPSESYAGTTGTALWKTVTQGSLRIRIVEYTAGYLADHWCEKGHAVFVLDGSFDTELRDGRRFHMQKGMGYLVADQTDAHRSSTKDGVRLLIVD